METVARVLGRHRMPGARFGAALAVVGLLTLAAPARSTASVQILNDRLTAQNELANAQTWAEAAGETTFPTSLQNDTVVALTASPQRPGPAHPPTGVRTNPGLGVDAESIPVLADGDEEIFILSPTRQQVSGQATRLCAYLMQGGVVQARGSRRLTVALANPPSPRPKHGGAGGGDRLTASGVLALIVVVLAGIGVVSTLRKLGRRKRHRGQPGAEATAGHPASASGEDTTGRNGATRAGPKASAPAPAATDRSDVRRVLRRVTFSKHAIERFADRADIPLTSYRKVELLIRELLAEEGEVRTERPFWSQSSNTADLYLQAGEWMLFVLERNSWLPWPWSGYTCVTAVNGRDDKTWENALQRGYIHTPPGAASLD